MCEIPNNVILIDAFAELFDGFSIGSNDLTQLTLGVDRDSEIVAFDFDERDPGMLEMFKLAVLGAKRNGRHIGICGEAPANYPEIARFLAQIGIDAISVNPSSILRTMQAICDAEASSRLADVPEAVVARRGRRAATHGLGCDRLASTLIYDSCPRAAGPVSLSSSSVSKSPLTT